MGTDLGMPLTVAACVRLGRPGQIRLFEARQRFHHHPVDGGQAEDTFASNALKWFSISFFEIKTQDMRSLQHT